MAKLITNHDPFHIHKILGLLVLIHYIYRFFLLFSSNTAFPENEDPFVASVGVFLHGLLSWSSLLLPLPAKRNFSSPMIWPEFRFHSINFASRHVICTIMTLNKLWPTNLIIRAVVKIALVLLTCFCATYITDHYGDKEKRTTNAMPYPKTISIDMQQKIKVRYARFQFLATMNCYFDDPTLCFTPILAIQAAPLLMTLVRKGKTTSIWFHRIYFLSLFFSWLSGVIRAAKCDYTDIIAIGALMALKLAYPLRVKYKTPRWQIWSGTGLFLIFIYPTFLREYYFKLGIDSTFKLFFSFVTFSNVFLSRRLLSHLFLS